MKYGLILFLVFVFSCNTVRKSNSVSDRYKSFRQFKGDTVKYLTDNFVMNKQMYINKKFNVLLNKLEIPVKSYLYHSLANDFQHSDAISILFCDDTTSMRKVINDEKMYHLYIKWDTLVSAEIIRSFIRAGDGWGKKEIKFFGKQTVKDIQFAITGNSRNKQ